MWTCSDGLKTLIITTQIHLMGAARGDVGSELSRTISLHNERNPNEPKHNQGGIIIPVYTCA